jgi:hypothetical protein
MQWLIAERFAEHLQRLQSARKPVKAGKSHEYSPQIQVKCVQLEHFGFTEGPISGAAYGSHRLAVYYQVVTP